MKGYIHLKSFLNNKALHHLKSLLYRKHLKSSLNIKDYSHLKSLLIYKDVLLIVSIIYQPKTLVSYSMKMMLKFLDKQLYLENHATYKHQTCTVMLLRTCTIH